jgi:hypothetical protein
VQQGRLIGQRSRTSGAALGDGGAGSRKKGGLGRLFSCLAVPAG